MMEMASECVVLFSIECPTCVRLFASLNPVVVVVVVADDGIIKYTLVQRGAFQQL